MSISRRMIRSMLVAIVIVVCVSCAAGSIPARSPKHVRKSVYAGNKGAALLKKGCYVRALDYFQETHQRYTAADNLEGVAHSLNSIADIYYRLGDMPSALLVYDDAIAVYSRLDNDAGLVRALSNKAATLIALDRPEQAASVLDRADALDGDGSQTALRFKIRALLQIKQKKFQSAKDLLARAMASADESEAAIRGSIYFSMGHASFMENRIDDAKEAFTQALAIDRTDAAYDDIARDLQALGRCYAQEGNPSQAVDYFKRSAKIFALLKNHPKADEVTAQLKESAAQAGQDIQATLYWIKHWLEDGKGVDLCD